MLRIQSRLLSALFKSALCAGALAGILIQSGLFTRAPNLGVFRYYTLLSNVLCALYFGAAAVCAARGRGAPLPGFKAALVMGITVTGLVYHFLLSGGSFSMGNSMAVSNVLLHYYTPAMAVLDWLLFDEKGRYGPRAPLFWVLLPDAYFVLATVYGFVIGGTFYGGGRFPYFFMDYDLLGVWRVLLYVAALNLAFIALGYVFYFADRLLARRRTRA